MRVIIKWPVELRRVDPKLPIPRMSFRPGVYAGRKIHQQGTDWYVLDKGFGLPAREFNQLILDGKITIEELGAPMRLDEVQAALESYLAEHGTAFADKQIGNARIIVIPHQHTIIYEYLPTYAEWQAVLTDDCIVRDLYRTK